jgi:hypothetical protein
MIIPIKEKYFEKNIQNKILAKILLFILSMQIDNIINQWR